MIQRKTKLIYYFRSLLVIYCLKAQISYVLYYAILGLSSLNDAVKGPAKTRMFLWQWGQIYVSKVVQEFSLLNNCSWIVLIVCSYIHPLNKLLLQQTLC